MPACCDPTIRKIGQDQGGYGGLFFVKNQNDYYYYCYYGTAITRRNDSPFVFVDPRKSINKVVHFLNHCIKNLIMYLFT